MLDYEEGKMSAELAQSVKSKKTKFETIEFINREVSTLQIPTQYTKTHRPVQKQITVKTLHCRTQNSIQGNVYKPKCCTKQIGLQSTLQLQNISVHRIVPYRKLQYPNA